ncbi:pyridoxal 5'-phosphate synthase glutaminase subunit PdxT [Thiospirochaeta perfilievii]|uniref:Pyridoxal 5'-phosphate synthase glutaminase subunit PdxT n=1 Tax=Thiospirochaeta perfilievii TaxID=252967 RepID=A0A5C1Q9R0_9SPIO|nr:pyridoxal 5'-phosphate synthase glutaminase subunit PdxT [Thiospirochaeta perfilievii]QEN03639.1 pyridoxal 5'-phosphate synthase glutaminase subunit PdxT [Thiospirochaeta perfilievii]
MVIGVLALQGSVEEHCNIVLSNCDKTILVKHPSDLNKIDALIIPGGESTTLIRLLKIKGLDRALVEASNRGLKIWGTCAGLILLSKKILCNSFSPLGLIDIVVDRNGYGSQVDSFETEIDFFNNKSKVRFIRAPKIVELGSSIEVLSIYNGEPIAVRSKNIFVTSFHPEVTNNDTFYKYFKSLI